MATEQIIVLGGGYAGIMAAKRLALQETGAAITLINASDTFVERIRLHQFAAAQALPEISIPGLLRGTGVKFVQGWVTELDPTQQSVRLSDGQTLRYTRLIYALGSAAKIDNLPGVRQHTYNVASLKDAARLRETLASQPDGRVVIVGGGLTGIESAAEIAETYPQKQVTLLTQGVVGAGVSQKGREHLAQVFGHMGVTVRENISVGRVEAGAIITESGEAIPFDVCVWAGSFVAAPLAREAGINVNERGQILTDATLRSVSHPEIYAIGDAAKPGDSPHIRMGCASAMPMGSYAAAHLAGMLKGKTVEPFSYGYLIQCISLGRHEALVQRVNPDDSAKAQIFTGWMAIQIKEMICKGTVWALRHPRVYDWKMQRYPISKDQKAVLETGRGHI